MELTRGVALLLVLTLAVQWAESQDDGSAEGVKGVKGEPGPKGSIGGNGVPGSDGSSGAPGPNGSIGGNGVPGPDGSAGAPGPNGSIGGNGVPGPDGSSGAPGPNYGSQKNPGLSSCANILKKRCDKLSNGVYWIKLKPRAEPFPVFCDMLAGGWTLVFKALAGVPGVMPDFWKSSFEMYEYSLSALNKNNQFKHHYKNRIVRYWVTAKLNQVRVVLYKQTKEEISLRFNAHNTNNLDWFSEKNLLEAPWVDIKTKTKNFFSVDGSCYSGYCRAFFINHAYNGCPNDIGWMSLGGGHVCAWETRSGFPVPSFLYSKVDKAVNWNDYSKVGGADVFAVYVR